MWRTSQRKRNTRRRAFFEPLESRWMLAAWQNGLVPNDVNNDDMVTPLDALVVINKLNADGAGPLVGPAPNEGPFYDVDGSDSVEPLDALIVFNVLNDPPAVPPAPKNIPLTDDLGVQQMPSVAVNPLDPDNVVVAYMDYSLVDTGYAGIGVEVSRNGGVTWTRSSIPVPEPFDQGAANPTVRFDDQGSVYMSFMAATYLDEQPGLTNPAFGSDRIPGFRSHNSVFVVRSDDGGSTWNEPVAIDSNVYDGTNEVSLDLIPDIAVDVFPLVDGEANPNYGNLYVTWNRNYAPNLCPGSAESLAFLDVRIAISRDRGETWEFQPKDEKSKIIVDVIDPPCEAVTNQGEGFTDQAHVTVGQEGEVYVSHWAGGNYGINVSHDGAATFQAPSFGNPCAEGLPVGCQIVFGTGFSTGMDATLPDNQFRTVMQKSIAADPTRPGTVYVVELINVVDEFGNQLDAADVYFGKSSDAARTFETKGHRVGAHPEIDDVTCDGGTGFDCINLIPLNDDNDALSPNVNPSSTQVASGQVFARVATDPDGNIAVIWYDTRRDPSNIELEVFGTVSTDGGETFSPNFRITDKTFDAHDGSFINAIGEEEFYLGDFVGLSMAGNTAYAAWTDTRHGNQDIFLTKFAIDAERIPPNDRFEPNDTPERNNSPTIVGPVIQTTIDKLSVTPSDIDWFLVESSAVGNLVADVLYGDPVNVSNGAVQLEIRDISGNTVLANATDLLDGAGQVIGKRAQYPTLTGEEFLIRVFGSGNEEVAYSLGLESLTENLGSRVYHTFGSQVETDQRLLYSLTAAATGLFDFTISGASNVQGQLTVSILDPTSLSILTESDAVTADAVVPMQLSVRKDQSILVSVAGGSGANGEFDVELTNRDLFAVDGTESLFFPVGGAPTQVTLEDLNDDAIPDAVVTSTLTDTVSVMLGNGDGTLQTPRQFTIGAYVTLPTDIKRVPFGRDVIVADFNQDAIPDIVVTNSGSADISLLIGNGDGTFQPHRRFEATPAPFDLDVGDINGDGLLDIVAIDTGLASDERPTASLAALISLGDGRFSPQVISPVEIDANNNGTLRIADLNEDGDADVVVSGDGLLAETSVYLGDGQGNFALSEDFLAGRLSVALAVGDVNEDTHVDVVTVGFEHGEGVLLLGDGQGSFAAEEVLFFGGQAPTAVQMIDFGSQVELPDGSTVLGPPDGRLDLVAAYSGVKNPTPRVGFAEVVVHPGLFDDQDQFLGFGDRQALAASVIQPRDVDVADMNGDGVPDAVVVDQGGVLVIFGEPPQFAANGTPETARDLGTTVHLVDQTQTVTPDRQHAYYTFTVPTEAVTSEDEVVDVSLMFEHPDGNGIDAELLDADGNVLGAGDRFRVRATQDETLTLHVFGISGGSGAFTPIIDVLPQVVSIESQTFLPGIDDQAGGPTTSVVITLQGDRLDPETAEDPANYAVTHFGPDRLYGTPDDQLITVQEVTYAPGSNIEVTTGRSFPTAVRQTVTLATDGALPQGSYRVDLSDSIRTADFNGDEANLLADRPGIAGHPVVSILNGQIAAGSRNSERQLVPRTGSLGDISVFNTEGTSFLTQLHGNMAAILDATLRDLGDDPSVPEVLIDYMRDRLLPTVGAAGERIASIMAIWLDPAGGIEFENRDGEKIEYDAGENEVVNENDECYINFDGNIEIIVCALIDPAQESFTLNVSGVPPTARGGSIQITQESVIERDLTMDLRGGQTQFEDFDF